jgi:hypothetical protein
MQRGNAWASFWLLPHQQRQEIMEVATKEGLGGGKWGWLAATKALLARVPRLRRDAGQAARPAELATVSTLRFAFSRHL